MSKTIRILMLPLALAALMAGCSQSPESNLAVSPQMALQYTPAAGDAVATAVLHVFVNQPSGRAITAHRITADWTETGVTWTNFGGAFAAGSEGSFLSDSYGWKTVDVTALVASWSDGGAANFGILLKQGFEEFPRTWINTRENALNHPYLEVCYATAGGPVCEMYPAIADASIAQNYPNDNYGLIADMFVGWPSVTDLEKQGLIRFDLPVLPEPASLGDFVWYDTNEDGIQDAGEVGVPGVVVHLMDCAGNVVGTTVTDANGFYLFGNLMPGDYNVHFVAPLGFVFSPQDQGSDDAADSDVNPANGMTICTTLESGENDMTWDAGLFLPPPPAGCTLTIGYWKNHAGFGPQPDYLSQFLPIWLGTPGGAKSMNVDNVLMAYNLLGMKTYGVPSNGITKLYAQLLAAKLNIANGSSNGAVSSVISEADTFLATHNHLDWSSLSRTNKNRVNGWMSTLDGYNNGLIGPGHCDQMGDGNDE